MTNIFKPLLWHALWNVDLISVPEITFRCGRTILERSAAERRYLITQIGEGAWHGMLAAWNRSDADQMAAIQLGTGAVLTEFFSAPVPLSPKECETVAHLGTLANLLVGVYDDIIDNGVSPGHNPLPRALLEAGSGRSAGDKNDSNSPLAPLVSAYFQEMARLPGLKTRPEVARTLRRAIMKMYDAERVTLEGDDIAGRMQGWRRKSILPFVVMGLPAWVVTHEFDAKAYRRHLRWLCRCGEFWGWIDDAMDIEQDAQTSHPNQVLETLRSCSQPPQVLAAHIAALGKNVLSEWHQMVPNAIGLPLAVQEALPTCLFSAFGGLPLSLLREEVT